MGGSTVLAALSAPAVAGAEVSVFPIPGMVTATKGTQISFRGTPLPTLRNLVGGRLPQRPPRRAAAGPLRRAGRELHRCSGRSCPGESVRVQTRLDIVGARNGDFSFRVGRRPPLKPTRLGEPPGVGNGAVQRYPTRPDLVPPAVTVNAAPTAARRASSSSARRAAAARTGR